MSHQSSPLPAQKVYSCSSDFEYVGGFENAAAAVSNLIARATTRWTLEQSKVFMIAVFQIEQRDEDCWVTIRKRDLLKVLGMNKDKDYSQLKRKLKNIQEKSMIELHGPSSSEKETGCLIRKVATDRHNVKIQFDEHYLPLLQYAKDQLYTSLNLQSILVFRHKSAYNLYFYLTDWQNKDHSRNTRDINKEDLAKVFNLKEGQYWRDYRTDHQKFHYPDFEKYCLNPAIQDINENEFCDMHIDLCEKIKDPENSWTVIGYHFKWHCVSLEESSKPRLLSSSYEDEFKYYEPMQTADIIHARSFMRRLRGLTSEKLENLSSLMSRQPIFPIGSCHSVWSTGELRQEASQGCLSSRFYNDLRRRLKGDNPDRGQLIEILGYNDEDEITLELDGIRKMVKINEILGAADPAPQN